MRKEETSRPVRSAQSACSDKRREDLKTVGSLTGVNVLEIGHSRAVDNHKSSILATRHVCQRNQVPADYTVYMVSDLHGRWDDDNVHALDMCSFFEKCFQSHGKCLSICSGLSCRIGGIADQGATKSIFTEIRNAPSMHDRRLHPHSLFVIQVG